METAEFPLGEVVHLAIDDAFEVVKQYHSTILCSIDSSLPERVAGELYRLRQILTNLLIAAARLSSAGQIRLSVVGGRERDSEIEVVFEVRAHPTDKIENTNAPTSESGIYRAESLLPASKKLVQLLGGEMGVQADAGAPPVLWCRIPVQRSTAAPQECNRVPLRQSLASEILKIDSAASVESVPCAKILMAEDNAINQRVGKLILRRAGYEIELVSDGNEAVEAHRIAPFDLILMDCQMPTMDGFEATRRIRSLHTEQPVIIAVTANALVGERERCLEAGMDDYLSKPFQADQLVSMVNKWVQSCPRR
jgi:CheY-like chemotaxis protein